MALDRRSDAELIAEVRRGDSDAYGVLYERHLRAAQRAAACLANTAAEREDLVADAFTRVLRALRGGGGPTEEFRAYLLVTLRNVAISAMRGATVSLYADVPETYLPRQSRDPVLSQWDASAAATAFASLPERWRTVLWHTEVEEESPAEIAPLLGLRPNGVAALAYRAREGLRQAYLRAHLAEVERGECRATVSKLAGWVRRSLPDQLNRKIGKHLAWCAECRERADTLATVNAELRSTVAPLLLGASLAAAYVPSVAPVTVAKTLFAKVGVAVAVAATAVTTVASAPQAAAPPAHVPALADRVSVTETTIQGPVPSGRAGGGAPPPGTSVVVTPSSGAPSVTVTTVDATVEPAAEPEETEEAAADQTESKADRKARKAADKAARKAAKAEAKAEKKAEKKAGKGK